MKSQATPKHLSTNQIHLLLHHLAEQPATRPQSHRNYCIAVLFLDAGLRLNELRRLICSDIMFFDVPVCQLQVRAEIAKRGYARTVPLTDRARNAIRDYAASQPLLFEHADQYAFCSPSSYIRPLSARAVQQIIHKAAKRSIGIDIHPHVLRHTYATRLMRVTDLRTVQELLGHRNVASTQIYTHPSIADKIGAVDKLT